MKYLKIIKRGLTALLMLLFVSAAQAQQTASQPEMADIMRSNGKIYVVVAILTVIFIGIVVYLFALDRKLNKLEKIIEDKK